LGGRLETPQNNPGSFTDGFVRIPPMKRWTPSGDALDTVMGRTREQWDQDLVKSHGTEWVEAHRGLLDMQWEYILSL
jgi:hypothetical protein